MQEQPREKQLQALQKIIQLKNIAEKVGLSHYSPPSLVVR